MPLSIGLGISPTLATGVGVDPIAAYFATGVNGFDFDFSKTDRLFQSTGSLIPADDTGEPVGLVLDWSRGGVYGPELGPGSDFSSLSQLIVPAGFSASVVNGRLRITRESTTADAQALRWKTGIVTAGVEYRLEVEIGELGGVGTSCFANALNGGTTNFWDNTYGGAGIRGRFNVANGLNDGRIWVNFGPGRAGNPATGAVGDWVEIARISLRAFVGNHGKQTLTNSQPKLQAGGIARADGSDDGLATTKKMGAAGFVMVKHNTASAPAATKVLCGASGASTDFGYCGVDTSGKGVARVGTGAALTSDDVLTGVAGTLGFWWNGSTAGLLVNGAKVKTQPQSGAPTTTQALALFYLNNNGSPGSWIGTDGHRFIHGDSAPDDATLLAFHNKLMAA